MTMIAIKTAIITFVLITLVVYILQYLAMEKRFVSPVFDSEYNLLMKFIPLV